MEDFVTLEEAPDYKINKRGDIKNKKGKILKSYICQNAKKNDLFHNEKRISCTIHMLVAKYFLPKESGFEDTVIHIDANTLNNDVANLKWINRSSIGRFGIGEVISDSENQWVCGFCDGDGSLGLRINKNKNGSASLQPFVMFAQSQNDGIPLVLSKIQGLYGGYFIQIPPKNDKQRLMHRLLIKRKEHVLRILDVMIRFSALKYNQAEYLKSILTDGNLCDTLQLANEKSTVLKNMHHSYNTLKIEESRLTHGYIGGLFDAEGCIFLSKQGRFTVSITQKGSPLLLQTISNKYNGNLNLRQDEVKWFYKHAKPILDILKDNCFGKLDQVKEGLQVIETICDRKESNLLKKRKMQDRDILYDNLKRQKKK